MEAFELERARADRATEALEVERARAGELEAELRRLRGQ